MKSIRLIHFSLIIMFLSFLAEGVHADNVQEKTLDHEVTVTLKLVQVYVTDQEGQPVSNLNQDNFKLYDNGKRQEITAFEKYILSDSLLKKLPAEEITLPVTEESSRKFVLFFDFSFNNFKGILKSKEAALHFIDNLLRPKDQLAVFSYSSYSGFTFHSDLTSDHAKVREIIQTFRPPSEILQPSPNMKKPAKLIDMSQSTPSAYKAMLSSKEALLKKEQEFKRENVFFDMKLLAKALKYIPGYKHIILFTSGFNDNPAQPSPRFLDMLKELASSQSAIYPISTHSLASLFDIHGNTESDVPPLGSPSLKRLADATGGRFFHNVQHFETIMQEIHDVTGCYYILGYYIDEKWDGKYHRVKINVTRPGCSVMTQEGYLNPKPFRKYSPLEKKLHLMNFVLGGKPHNQEELSFPMEAIPFSIGDKDHLLIVSKLNREIQKEITGRKVELFHFLLDKENKVVDVKKRDVNLENLPESDIYPYFVTPYLQGEFNCRVLLRNLHSGKTAAAYTQVIVPKVPEMGLKIDPPLMLVPSNKAIYIEAVSQDGRMEEAPSFRKYYNFDSGKFSPAVGPVPKGCPSLRIILPHRWENPDDQQIKISLDIFDGKSGASISPEVIYSTEEMENSSVVTNIDFPISELESGDYIVLITVKNKITNETAMARSVFSIKYK